MDTVAAYGHWPSPLSAAQAAAGKVSLSEVSSDGSSVYWLESRPAEGGRVVFVRGDDAGGDPVDMTPEGVSIRSRVHEYGGGASCLVPGHGPGAFAYVDAADQGVWLSRGAGVSPVAISGPPPAGERWVHGGLGTSSDGDWVVAVREVHREDGDVGDDAASGQGEGNAEGEGDRAARDGHARGPRRCIVALGTRPENAGDSILAEGHDFYGAPQLDAMAGRLAMAVWDHPDMPWDRSAIVVTPLEIAVDQLSGRSQLVVGGAPWTVEGGDDISVGQPAWQRDGTLRFISDRRGWWQPYVHAGLPDGAPAVALTAVEAEFHGPDWALGQSTMAELANGRIVARMTSEGRDSLVVLTPPGQIAPPIQPSQPGPPDRRLMEVFDHVVAVAGICAHKDGIACIGASPRDQTTVLTVAPFGPPKDDQPIVLHLAVDLRPRPSLLAPSRVAMGHPFAFEGRTGRRVHGLVYRPTLEGTVGPAGDRPPLVVMVHSGPTGSVGAGFDVVVQYFTSRGFAVAAVDYAGSTGYGREYRCSLWGQWGVLDTQDCVDAARFLAADGQVDGTRMAIRGTSSGGLTALNALADGAQTFAAAASWYGVSDLGALAASTHDFEAHYLDRLVGPLPAAKETYEARSPVGRAGDISGAVLLLQGLDDRVVPPAQTERLHGALLADGRHCTVRYFEGEGHGFRRAETLEACLEEELAFYLRELSICAIAPRERRHGRAG
jgi:dienelactone hydrolase